MAPSPTVVDHTAITQYFEDVLEEGYEPTFEDAVASGVLPRTPTHEAIFNRGLPVLADRIAALSAGPDTRNQWHDFTNPRGNTVKRYLIPGDADGGIIASVKYRPLSSTYKFTMNGGEYRIANTIEELR